MATADYLLHFERSFKHARHYVGFVEDEGKVSDRLKRHADGGGAALTRAVSRAGIGLAIVRTWQGKSRRFERRLKNQKHHTRLCPLCNPSGFAGRTRRTAEA